MEESVEIGTPFSPREDQIKSGVFSRDTGQSKDTSIDAFTDEERGGGGGKVSNSSSSSSRTAMISSPPPPFASLTSNTTSGIMANKSSINSNGLLLPSPPSLGIGAAVGVGRLASSSSSSNINNSLRSSSSNGNGSGTNGTGILGGGRLMSVSGGGGGVNRALLIGSSGNNTPPTPNNTISTGNAMIITGNRFSHFARGGGGVSALLSDPIMSTDAPTASNASTGVLRNASMNTTHGSAPPTTVHSFSSDEEEIKKNKAMVKASATTNTTNNNNNNNNNNTNGGEDGDGNSDNSDQQHRGTKKIGAAARGAVARKAAEDAERFKRANAVMGGALGRDQTKFVKAKLGVVVGTDDEEEDDEEDDDQEEQQGSSESLSDDDDSPGGGGGGGGQWMSARGRTQIVDSKKTKNRNAQRPKGFQNEDSSRPSRKAAETARNRGYREREEDDHDDEENEEDDEQASRKRNKLKHSVGGGNNMKSQQQTKLNGRTRDDDYHDTKKGSKQKAWAVSSDQSSAEEEQEEEEEEDDDDGGGSEFSEDDDDDESNDEDHDNDLTEDGKARRERKQLTENEINELSSSGASCLRHLPKADKAKFAKLWKEAHNIASLLKETMTSSSSSSSSYIVTAKDLRTKLGWGGVSGASDIATSGRAGTSSGNGNAGGSSSSSSSISASVPPPTAAALASSLSLTPFQLIGLNWLLLLHRAQTNGVLADEMGLGKSIQTLALLEWLRATEGNSGPHLIVTPASTVSNWVREAKKWTPNLRVRTYRGGGLDRAAKQRSLMYGGPEDDSEQTEVVDDDLGDETKEKKKKKKKKSEGGDDGDDNEEEDASEDEDEEEDEEHEEEMMDEEDEEEGARRGVDADATTPRAFDILITTYTMFDRQGITASTDRLFLRRYPWHYLICDEGHSLKNAGGQRFRQLTSMGVVHRLLLSGTPIQNSIPELFSLLRFIHPNLFTHRIEKIFTHTSEKMQKSDIAQRRRLDDLRRVLHPFVLRRSKSEVLRDLPPKVDTTVCIPMPAMHATQYVEVVKRMREQIAGRPAAAAASSSSAGGTGARRGRKPNAKNPNLIDAVIEVDDAGLTGVLVNAGEDVSSTVLSSSTVSATGAGDGSRPSRNAARKAQEFMSVMGVLERSKALVPRIPKNAKNGAVPSQEESGTPTPAATAVGGVKRKRGQATTIPVNAADGGVTAVASSYGTARSVVRDVNISVESVKTGNDEEKAGNISVLDDSVAAISSQNGSELDARRIGIQGSNTEFQQQSILPPVLEMSASVESIESLDDDQEEEQKGRTKSTFTTAAVSRSSSTNTTTTTTTASGVGVGARVTEDDAATAAALKRSSARLSKKAANGLFGDLRKISQHPLLLRTWFSDSALLTALSTALYEVGAFGFQPGCTPSRVFYELLESSDWEIFELCLQYGFELSPLPDTVTLTTLSNSTLKCEDGLKPLCLDTLNFTDRNSKGNGKSTPLSSSSSFINFSPASPASFAPLTSAVGEGQSRALLRAAARGLPPWAFEESAKLAHLKSWLPQQLADGHRVLIFSQLMATLSMVSLCLSAWGIRWLRLDGSTPVPERQKMLDVFANDPGIGVFLLSTKAGGLGLNLTAADTVVLHDSDWNPHADAQAVDRAHRLGQTRAVRVFRLVTAGTLDEHIARIAQKKLELDRALRTNSAASGAGAGGGGGSASAAGEETAGGGENDKKHKQQALAINVAEALAAALLMTGSSAS